MEEEIQKFDPFELAGGKYLETGTGLIRSRILHAFRNVFNVPTGLVSSKFKEVMNKVLQENYPDLRCSSARAIFEGRIPGVAKPIETINPNWKKQLEQCFAILDLMETIVFLYLEEEIQKSTLKIKSEVKGVSKAIGSTKLSGLVQFLDQEKK